MAGYLIDTGVLTAFLLNRRQVVSLLTPWIDAEEARTSILVYGEAVEYVLGFPAPAAGLMGLRTLVGLITPLPLTQPVMERHASLRRTIPRSQGIGTVGDIDTLIAATALEHGLTVVTADDHFQRVPNAIVHSVKRAALKSR
jgi:predicted nucleic acid-binding protein